MNMGSCLPLIGRNVSRDKFEKKRFCVCVFSSCCSLNAVNIARAVAVSTCCIALHTSHPCQRPCLCAVYEYKQNENALARQTINKALAHFVSKPSQYAVIILCTHKL